MNTNDIKEIIKIFEQSQISSMDLEVDSMKIKLEKKDNVVMTSGVPQTISVPSVPTETTKEEGSGQPVNSPLVGVFWQSSKQGMAPYVEVGSTVHKGDILCIVEAMKSMNEIRSEVDGIVKEILVKDGDLVEFAQPLMIIGD